MTTDAKPKDLMIERGAIAVYLGSSVVKLSTSYHGLTKTSCLFDKTDLDDAIEVLVAMRELVDPRPPTKPEDAWRDVAADMIRMGKDHEAVALLAEKTPLLYVSHFIGPSAAPYIVALEAFFNCFEAITEEDIILKKTGREAVLAYFKIQELQRT